MDRLYIKRAVSLLAEQLWCRPPNRKSIISFLHTAVGGSQLLGAFVREMTFVMVPVTGSFHESKHLTVYLDLDWTILFKLVGFLRCLDPEFSKTTMVCHHRNDFWKTMEYIYTKRIL